jgi:Flp pilus assembly CpaF family ATPase
MIPYLLSPLTPYLDDPDILECSVIRAGEVHLEKEGAGYCTLKAPQLTYSYWETLCHGLANHHGLYFHVLKQPRLSVMLPGGHRFEALLGSTVESSLSISIRMKRSLLVPLEDFGLKGDLKEEIVALIQRGANILISGGTSSGKTTFMNRLIQEIPSHKRVLVVEDTRELFVPQENHQYYVISRNEGAPVIDYAHLIDHLMRSRPDVILMGELSMNNAYPLLRLLNSGHAGFLCTLHANSPDLALSWAIPQNISFSGYSVGGVKEFLYEAVDAVIQLHKQDNGTRGISEILFPKESKTLSLRI